MPSGSLCDSSGKLGCSAANRVLRVIPAGFPRLRHRASSWVLRVSGLLLSSLEHRADALRFRREQRIDARDRRRSLSTILRLRARSSLASPRRYWELPDGLQVVTESTTRKTPIRAVVFDLFDTLVDIRMEAIERVEFQGAPIASNVRALYDCYSERVRSVEFERFAKSLQAVDAEFRRSRYAQGLELPTRERFATVVDHIAAGDRVVGGGKGVDRTRSRGTDARLVEQLVDVHMGAVCEQVRMPDHHPAVLARLGSRVRLALCSNFSHTETALRVLDDNGLRPHLGAIVVSATGGFRKPRPEIFRQVLADLGVDPADTLHVGDNLIADVRGAAALGIRTVWLTRRVADPDARLRDYDGPAPDFRCEDLAELDSLLEELGVA
jgi:FMN phosphatase YigB (HAD superfamily)